VATILVLSGPNLNLLGEREPAIYGTDTLDECVGDVRSVVTAHHHELEHYQSNHEGELVDAVQGARHRCGAIIVNAAALTHYSYALADALACYDGVTVELHLTNPSAREPWRHHSVITPVVTGTVTGFGRVGYRLAAEAVVAALERPNGKP
jgi:3-dehydroquinate dehydratase II